MKVYTEEKAEKLLSRSVPVAKSIMTNSVDKALAFSKKSKYPVVIKMISSQALHKTEANGVRIVNSDAQLSKEYSDMVKVAKKKKIKLAGILVQEFINGQEVIIGIKNDDTFGHVIGLGVGGKYTELLKDITFRACPITEADAQDMIKDLKLKKLLYGFRGSKPVNIKLLKQVMVKVSELPAKNKKIMELDINPFIINDKFGKVVDARIVFE